MIESFFDKKSKLFGYMKNLNLGFFQNNDRCRCKLPFIVSWDISKGNTILGTILFKIDKFKVDFALILHIFNKNQKNSSFVTHSLLKNGTLFDIFPTNFSNF